MSADDAVQTYHSLWAHARLVTGADDPITPGATLTSGPRSPRASDPCRDDAAIAAALVEEDAAARGRSEAALLQADLETSFINASPFDAQLSSRLSMVPSVRLLPKVINLFPEEGYVSEDRLRLLSHLKDYDLSEYEVKGDGNCQFRALSDQLYGEEDLHTHIRTMVVAQIRRKASRYSGYVPTEFKQYCSSMEKDHAWGDHVTLQAAADVFGLKITVITSYKEQFLVVIEPEVKKSERVLWLSFWAEVHYNSVYPMSAPPNPKSSGLKVLGSKRLGKLIKFGVM